jgi:hypothetical protein
MFLEGVKLHTRAHSPACPLLYPPFRRPSTLENIRRFALFVNFEQCRFRGFSPVGRRFEVPDGVDFQGSLFKQG